MKVVVSVNKPVVKIPEVGQLWKHGNNDRIYMRIDQDEGEKVHHQKGCFYSVDLLRGNIVYTFIDACGDVPSGIIICEPVGGTLEVKAIS